MDTTEYLFNVQDVLDLADGVLENYYVSNSNGADYCAYCFNRMPYMSTDELRVKFHSPDCTYLIALDIKTRFEK